MQYYASSNSRRFSGEPNLRRYESEYDRPSANSPYRRIPANIPYDPRVLQSNALPYYPQSRQPPVWSLPIPMPYSSVVLNQPRELYPSLAYEMPLPISEKRSYHNRRDFELARDEIKLAKSSASHLHADDTRRIDARPRYFCELCKVVCIGDKSYKYHIRCHKHRRRERAKKKLNEASSSKSLYSVFDKRNAIDCPLCEVRCQGALGYKEHLLGKAHTRAVNIYKQLGKEVPDCEAIIRNLPAGSTALKPKTTEFKPESTTFSENFKPFATVAKFITTVNKGGSVSRHCGLCNCFFKDPIEAHILMRRNRHRKTLKKFNQTGIDISNLISSRAEDKAEVSVTASNEYTSFSAIFWGPRLSSAYSRPANTYYSPSCRSLMFVTRDAMLLDDTYILRKLHKTTPSIAEKSFMMRTVKSCENALIEIMDLRAQQLQGTTDESIKPSLQGVFRVGSLITGMFLTGEKDAELVVITSECPTADDTAYFGTELETSVKDSCKDCVVSVDTLQEDGTLFVHFSNSESSDNKSNFSTVIHIQLTSLAVFTNASSDDQVEKAENSDVEMPCNCVSKEKCLNALIEVRRTLWLQDFLPTHVDADSLVNVAIILKDIIHKGHPSKWGIIPDFALLILLERLSCRSFPLAQNAVTMSAKQIQPCLLLRRFLEALSAGVLLPSAECSFLEDPSKNGNETISSLLNIPLPDLPLLNLSSEEREDATDTAQKCLLLLVTKQIYKILDVEPSSSGGPDHEGKGPSDDDVSVLEIA